MPEKRTIMTTFGFRHGSPPQADQVFDVRDVEHHDLDAWEQAAADIASQIQPGEDVAIGCEDGDDRSVHIARLIQKIKPDIVVVDRDLQPGAGNPNKKPMLKGKDRGVMGANTAMLKHGGMSEEDAVRHSIRAAGVDEEEE